MSMPVLRPYQQRGIEAGRAVLRKKKRRFAFYSPTGSGKTTMGMAFIASAMAKGKRVAFIANRIHLVSQASREFAKAGIQHGVIQGDNSFNTSAGCLVCSIQTVARRGLPPVDLIIIDEGHGVPGSKDYLKVIFENNNIPIIALTATPFSRGMAKVHDELLGEPLFEDLVVVSTIRELIDLGFLVDCEIYAPSDPDLSGVKTIRNKYGEMDYEEASLADAVFKPKLMGDIVSHWLKVGRGRPTVCFATNVAHSRAIVEKFQEAGIPAGHIDGYMKDEERNEVLDMMTRGEIKVLSNVGVLREGWDFPAAEILIMARPTKSLIAWIQMCGRVLRPFPGKDVAIILDHSGSAHELGYPTDDLPLELCDGNVQKSDSKPQEKKEPSKPKKCPKCHFMKPAGQHKCSKCGFAPERVKDVESAEGDLTPLERKKASKYSMQEKSEIYSSLLGYARRKGLADGWAYYKTKEITGVYPVGTRSAQPGPMCDAVRKWFAHEAIQRQHGSANREQRNAA